MSGDCWRLEALVYLGQKDPPSTEGLVGIWEEWSVKLLVSWGPGSVGQFERSCLNHIVSSCVSERLSPRMDTVLFPVPQMLLEALSLPPGRRQSPFLLPFKLCQGLDHGGQPVLLTCRAAHRGPPGLGLAPGCVSPVGPLV